MKRENKKIKGATMIEYILITGLVGAATIIPLWILGGNSSDFFSGLGQAVVNATRYLF